MLVSIVVILGSLSLLSSVSAANDIDITVSMDGESAQTRFDHLVLVAGLWHLVDIDMGGEVLDQLTLKLFEGTTVPIASQRNATNYYEWTYDESSDLVWQDVMMYGGRTYIDADNCSQSNSLYRFAIGVKDTFPSIEFYHENWTLEIYAGQDNLFSEVIVIEKPTLSLARSHAETIEFYVDPFTEMDADGDDYFKVENKGNVPLELSVDYPTYAKYLECEHFETILSVKSGKHCNIILHSDSWMAGIGTVTGTIEGTIPSPYVIYTDQLTFLSAPVISASTLKINVGHANHEIVDLGDGIIFQYEKSLTMNEGEVREIHAYLSGNGEATLNISSDETNSSIRNIQLGTIQVTPPISITSTNTSEQIVTITVEALRENKVGTIYYTLDVDGNIREFTTTITVEVPQSGRDETTTALPFATIIILLCVVLVVVYMLISYLRHRG